MKENTPTPQQINRIVQWLKAIADETRVELLLELKKGPSNVTKLVEKTNLAQATVSKHLGIMKRAGILDVRREGPQSIYFIRDEAVFEVCRIVCDGIIRDATDEKAHLIQETNW